MSAKWVSLSAKWVSSSAKWVSLSAKWVTLSAKSDSILITKFLVGWKPLEVENKPYRTIPVTFLPRLTPQFALCQIDSDSLLQWVFTIDYLENPKIFHFSQCIKITQKVSTQVWVHFESIMGPILNQFYGPILN